MRIREQIEDKAGLVYSLAVLRHVKRQNNMIQH